MSQLNLKDKPILDASTEDLFWQKVKRVDAFNFNWKKADFEKPEALLKELKELATIASVGSSTRIEGSTLNNQEVKELIDNMEINKLKTRDQEEVAGYYEAIKLIHEDHGAILLSEGTIKQLHSILLKYSSKDNRHKGLYKNLSNKVVAQYPDGLSRVIFNTTEPYLVEMEMRELVKWTNEKLEDTNFHPVLIIAIFIYEFLSIHPFQDGNGRMSRLLTNLLLVQAGYKFIPYISLEHIIEERKKDYYRVLMNGQKNRYTDNENISLWVIFFVECIEVLITRLNNKLERVDDKEVLSKSTLNIERRQKLIIEYVDRYGSASISDLSKVLPDIPKPTLKTDLVDLLSKDKISKHGKGRGTYYKLK